IANAGGASGDFFVAGVDRLTLTLTTAPGGSCSVATPCNGAIISGLVEAGIYAPSGIGNHTLSYDASDGGPLLHGALTRNDGTSWLDSGFFEGQLIKIGSDATLYKIE